jgi:RNA exonuclease 4
VVYDQFVRPPEKITDFRTRWSGVTPEALKGALTFRRAQKEVSDILEGRVLVGE